MRIDDVPAAATAWRPTRRGLLWITLFALSWTGLIYAFPVLPESGLAPLAVRLAAHGFIALGLWIGLERTDLTTSQRRATWLTIMALLTLWEAVTWTAAINGVFRAGAFDLPLLPLAIFLPVVIGILPVLLSKRMGQLLDAMPAPWLVALQLYRVFGSQWLAYWLRGLLPGLWALPAGSGDVLTGLFAVPTAIALSAGTPKARKAAILWNLFGLADFAIAIPLGIIASPGPFQLIVSNGPTIGLGGYPDVLTPAFVVPSSILLHFLSLRQLRRQDRAEART